MVDPDILLIDRALAGDGRSLEILLERHLQGIFNVCLRICQDEDDAHDITQNVCVKIMKNLPKFAKRAVFKTWIFRIAYNESLQFLRSRRESVDLESVEPFLGKLDDHGIDRRDMEKQVRKSLESLKPIDRSIILFCYYDDLKIREVAEIMNMNDNTVKTRLSRAKKLLQAQLEDLWKNL